MRAAQAERERDAACAHRRRRGARTHRTRAPRHRRARRQRHGAPGRRRPAQAARRARRGSRRAHGRRAAGRTALTEMRRLLAAMRSDDDDVELGPQPGLDELDSLLQEVGAQACPFACMSTASRSPLPRAIDLSAYRIVQEGLTNALKHAHASSADVTLRYEPRRAADRGPRRRRRRRDERRPRPRPRRHPRAREDLRRRDDRRQRRTAAASSSDAPAASREKRDDDPRARRRRPVDGPRGLSHAALAARRTSRSSPKRATASRPSTRRRASTRPSC